MIPSSLPLRARNLGQACAVLPVGNMSPQDVMSIGLDNGAEKVGALMNFQHVTGIGENKTTCPSLDGAEKTTPGDAETNEASRELFLTETHASLFRML